MPPASPVAIATNAQQVNSRITIENVAGITATSTAQNANSIFAATAIGSTGSPVSVENSPISVDNSGDIEADQLGILALSYAANSSVTIANSGSVTATGAGIYESAAIIGIATGADRSVVINNSGTTQELGAFGLGVYAIAVGARGTNLITNSGSVYGSFAGILGISSTGTTIVNSGDISAGSNFAIGVQGAAAQIYNSGHITGFVALTKYGDTFINQKGGVFETKLTSYFGYGNDVFVNEQGGTVLAASIPR